MPFLLIRDDENYPVGENAIKAITVLANHEGKLSKRAMNRRQMSVDTGHEYYYRDLPSFDNVHAILTIVHRAYT